MRRGPQPAKSKAKLAVARKSPKNDDARLRDLEKRLAEALQREADALKREAEAQEQQTATAGILRVISTSPTNLQPVLDAVVKSAARFCAAPDASIFRLNGENLRADAHHGPVSQPIGFLVPVVRGTVAGRSVLERRAVSVTDLQVETDEFPEGSSLARETGQRATLSAPLLREGVPIGVILLRRGEAVAFTDKQIALLKTFADQAVIAIENVRLFNETKEALERQTATADILRVISRSPSDIQPVFDAIVQSAVKLCEGMFGTVLRLDGDRLHLAAHHNLSPAGLQAYREHYPVVVNLRETVASGVILDRRVVQVIDSMDPAVAPRSVAMARATGFRGVVVVPMLRDGEPIGVINVARQERGPFTDRQVALLQTFADQAVIAIENVRLFNETKEALERQTATAEMLRVISRSPTDIQPVLEAIAESVARLCDSPDVTMFRIDGGILQLAIHRGPIGSLPAYGEERVSLDRGSVVGRSVIERRTIHLADLSSEDVEYPEGSARARRFGNRAVLSVPLLKEDEALGAIAVRRTEARPFTEQQVALLQTFGDQAVIAIENVRLFKELQEKNGALTEALEQQTATSEILRTIAHAQTDVQPVFETIVQSAARLCHAFAAAVFLTDGRMLYEPANYGGSPEARAATRARYPRPVDMDTTVGIAVLTKSVVHVPDTEEPSAVAHVRQSGRLIGFRGCVTVPMLRENEAVGAIFVARREPGRYSEAEVTLLKTFADQAVIAIENVRLFSELQASNRELTTALDTQTATSDILRVIGQSPTDVQPVFDAIVQSAVRLLRAYSGVLTRIEGDQIVFAALTSTDETGDAALRATFPQSVRTSSTHGRVIRDRTPFNIADAHTDPRIPEAVHAYARVRGYRSQILVPLLRHEEPVGTISITRREAGGFTDDEIALLKTFADQAVIAIENVRLFTELQEKNQALTQAHGQVTEALDQQTATSEILRVISSSPTDVQPVFDTIARSAVSLCDASFGAVFQMQGDLLDLVAHDGISDRALDGFRSVWPMRPNADSIIGRALLTAAVVQVEDAASDLNYRYSSVQEAVGYRTIAAVPMRRENQAIGVISTWRLDPRPFSANEIELLKTFADQAVIAIENVRLFKELEARTHDLTRSVGELRALGEIGQAISSTLDLRTVLSTIAARATQLSGTDAGVIYEYDEQREVFVPRATEHLEADIVETMLATPVRKGEGATGRLAEVQEPIQVPDILAAPAESRVRGALLRAGYRALLAVPLVRDDHLLGGLTVIRKATGAFAPEVIELLTTFATQSALAIQNARLFREIEDKSRQLEVASQHKSEFLANMSHELRTPLNAIIGFSEVLTDRMFGELNEKQDEYLKDIYASGTHLLSLINDILDLSKIEAGRMELELTDFDLPAALDNALMLVRERAQRRSLTLHTDVDAGVGQIQGDERKIRQVVLNLLSNAIKFTPEGGRIEVAAAPKDGSVEVSVSDTGVGIAPEDQEAVFEEFRQVGTAEKKAEGTGLGLTLCRKFIELHGGRIWVKSQLGAGSTFTFTIPVRRGE